MGKVIEESWECDRCKKRAPQRPKSFVYNYTIEAGEWGEWAGSLVINWKEMCGPCNEKVGAAIKALNPALDEVEGPNQ